MIRTSRRAKIAERSTRTPVSLYMQEIGEVPLLSVRRRGRIGRTDQAVGDEAAREHMIRANLRLVVKIARDYENLGLPLSGSGERGQHRA